VATVVQAQSSVTIYAVLDVAADSTTKSGGALPDGSPLRTNVGDRYRLSPSMSAVTSLGFRGTEDLGGGHKAGFTVEMQPALDDGTLGNDGRAWGRQAFVSWTTPYGEVRLGRQYAPMFYAKAFSTTERMGGTDLFTSVLTVNQLQARQDNQISYWLRQGKFTGSVAYSPNGGVSAGGINANRAAFGATPGGAQMLGGATAGGEGRGKSWGAFVNYADNPVPRGEGFSVSAAFHGNKFDVPLYLGVTTALPLGVLDDFKGYAVAGRYIAASGWAVAVSYGHGAYDFKSSNPFLPQLARDGLDVRTLTLGARYTFGAWTVGAMAGRQEFTNFTKGKNTAYVLGGDYALSSRTALYLRYGHLKDDEGTAVLGGQLSGGPEPILVSTGLREVPAWNNVGVNPGGTSSSLSLGIRHTF
jgi:predicted porin